MMKKNQRTMPNLITYNSLLDGLVKADRLQETDGYFQEMLLSETLSPDLITFSTLLKGYCRKGDVDKVKEIFNLMNRMKIQPDESLL
jgi:pentatricopeptide repeat protein